ncbi:MAG: hypothetical protein PHW13_07660 [Methylococcales bacterium]|nr:hypothetical protein [Methylococcales bacterium]
MNATQKIDSIFYHFIAFCRLRSFYILAEFKNPDFNVLIDRLQTECLIDISHSQQALRRRSGNGFLRHQPGCVKKMSIIGDARHSGMI